jgi:hypothetical protein
MPTRKACSRTSGGSLWAAVQPSVDEDAVSVRKLFLVLVHRGKAGRRVEGLVENGVVEPQLHELAVWKHPCLVECGPRRLPFLS